jgi:hypothetical protein
MQRIGGLPALQSAWRGDDVPDRSTIERWEKGQLPRNSDRLLQLAACLDVDPIAILDLPTGNIEIVAERMMNMVQGVVGSPASLKFSRQLLGRLRHWPPADLACEYYGRNWFAREFQHDASIRQNYYETMEIIGEPAKDGARPQVFHFAFRHPRRFAGRWLQYGFVRIDGRRVSLWHIDGHNERYDRASLSEPARIRTWLGPSSVTFRIASLHDFELTTLTGREPTGPTVTFPG